MLKKTLKALFENKSTIPYDVDMTKYLKKHDVVFRTPQLDGYEGLPFGNGDIGGMVWTDDHALKLQLNKSDLWTMADEEDNLLLRALSQISINFMCPCFAYASLDEFEARLSLAQGKITYKAETSFTKIEVDFITDQEENAIILHVVKNDKNYDGKAYIDFNIERYGSRSYPYWYDHMSRDSEGGLGNAESFAQNDFAGIYEPFSDRDDLSCITMSTIISKQQCAYRKINDKHAKIEIPYDNGAADFHIIVSAASSLDIGSNGKNKLFSKGESILNSIKSDINRSYVQNDEYWNDYWNRSMISMDSEDIELATKLDYTENLYYIHQYILACGSRGKYPLAFNAGTFTWNRDIRQWVNPHHWNEHPQYMLSDCANRPEIMKPYLMTYSHMENTLRERTKKELGIEGVILAEKHDYNGRCISFLRAFTPAMQIGMILWFHYQYNKDINYLKEHAYSFLSGCADFYTNYATYNEESKCYDIYPAAPCECAQGEDYKNNAVDLCMARAILSAAIEASIIIDIDQDKRSRWQNLLDNIAPFKYIIDDTIGERIVHANMPDGTPVDRHYLFHNSFGRSTNQIHPAGLIDIDDKGSRLFNASVNVVTTLPSYRNAIQPVPVYMARLGLPNLMFERIFYAINQLQHFPQGLYYNLDHWQTYSKYSKFKQSLAVFDESEIDDEFLNQQRDYIYDDQCEYKGIRVVETNEKIDLPMKPFVQCGFETASYMSQGLHECALQDYKGVIRVFPAIMDNMSYVFTLRARGEFIVSSYKQQNEPVKYVKIVSRLGGYCVVSVDMEGEIRIADEKFNEVKFTKNEKGHIKFDTQKGKSYILYNESAVLKLPEVNYSINNDSKTMGYAKIGRKRMY